MLANGHSAIALLKIAQGGLDRERILSQPLRISILNVIAQINSRIGVPRVSGIGRPCASRNSCVWSMPRCL